MEIQKKLEADPARPGDKPDYKGSLDVAAWVNTDRDGKKYLSVVLGSRAKLVPNQEKAP